MKEISFDQVESDVPAGARFSELPRGVLGYKIFKWLLLLVGVLLFLLTMYAVFTYPSPSDARLLADDPAGAAVAYGQLKSDWLSSVKDLGQIFIITPVLPLIGAVLGYIFGKDEQSPSSSSDE